MTPHFQSANVTIFNGDCLEVLRTLPDESVHCCVTSPPYWGLRDYGTAKWDGGSEGCDHSRELKARTERNRSGLTGSLEYVAAQEPTFKESCGKCGAIRIDSQLGLERTPEEYIAKMVAVFAEVKRVLRDDGTLWLNMGDSYANTGLKDASKVGGFTGDTIRRHADGENIKPKQSSMSRAIPFACKPKDLIGIPWMLAFALRADGWYLRSDIIWSKPNPMPESVTDRPTKAHEYIFLMSKSERYFYDAEAIKESAVTEWEIGAEKRIERVSATGGAISGGTGSTLSFGIKRNKRSVWEVGTQPFPEAHFATFPEELIKPCILAGCPAGGTVLDPFFGSGTTGLVAQTNGCKAIGIELNASYIEIAKRRLRQEVLELSPATAPAKFTNVLGVSMAQELESNVAELRRDGRFKMAANLEFWASKFAAARTEAC